MTAAAFAKGLLALEGELTPILVQMVKSANTNGLLDNDCESSKYQTLYDYPQLFLVTILKFNVLEPNRSSMILCKWITN